jgi:hypothetical protein
LHTSVEQLCAKTYLDDGVRDLTGPEGPNASVEVAESLSLDELRQTIDEATGELGACLDAHLDGLERAQGNVGEELGRGRGAHVDEIAVLERSLRANGFSVVVLEEFVETEFEETLQGVTDEGGPPALEEARDARAEAEVGQGARVDGPETLRGALEVLRIGLSIALDEIDRCHSRVGETARQDTAEAASREVLKAVELDGLRSEINSYMDFKKRQISCHQPREAEESGRNRHLLKNEWENESLYKLSRMRLTRITKYLLLSGHSEIGV